MSGPQLAGLLERIARIGSRLGVHIASLSEGAETLDAAIAGLEQIEAQIQTMAPQDSTLSQRLEEIESVIFGLVQLDFSRRASLSPVDDPVNAIAVGVNCLGEELSLRAVSKTFVDQVIESMPDGLAVTDRHGKITLANQAAGRFLGRNQAELLGEQLAAFFPGLAWEEILQAVTPHELETQSPASAQNGMPLSLALSALRDGDGQPLGLVCVLRDLSERNRQERERWRLREEVQRQAMYMDELSSPIIPLSDQVLVMPIIGSVDARRAERILETLLNGIVERRARLAILDLTGMRITDDQGVHALRRAIAGVRMLGAKLTLTGIRPDLARTLIERNIRLDDVQTVRSLQDGIAAAIGRAR